jgi:MerR family transcriptional regulator, copper efflux regulator
LLIHEIARITGMSRDGVRHYEELGLIHSTPRQAGSRIYRDYDAAVLETIERVHQAQRLGFTLKEIVPLLRAYGNAKLSLDDTVDFLRERLTVVHEKQAALAEAERFIRQKIDRYEKALRAGNGAPVPHPHCPVSSNLQKPGVNVPRPGAANSSPHVSGR